MIFNSKYTIKLKFLDSILNSLIDSKTHSLSYSVLYEMVMTSSSDKIKILDLSDVTNSMVNGLNYLISENLITILNNSDVYITYKGILKLSKGGFVREYKQTERKRLFDKYTSIILFIFSVITFFISFYTLKCFH